MGRPAPVTYAAVGDTIDNGFDLGGSRIYPWSRGLALTPPSMYSNYIGNGSGVPIVPPAASLPATSGAASGVVPGAVSTSAAVASPFGSASPLPWVVVGLIGAVGGMYVLHYKKGKA